MGKTEKVTRPESAAVKQTTAAALQADGQLKAILDARASQQAAVRAAAQGVFDARLRDALQEMDIQQLNKGRQGLRLPLLREAGVENVWQASQMSFRQICDINGLGEQSAEKIQETIRQITENTKESLRVRIRADAPAKEDDSLIQALFIAVNCGPLQDRCQQIYTRHHNGVQAETKQAKLARNGLAWLLSSQDKKCQAVQALDSLQQRLVGELGSVPVQQYRQAVSAELSACWADFEKRSADYYATLEALGSSWKKYDTTKNGLTVQLAMQIEGRGLQLQHLKATLRSYQTFGTKYILHQERVLLGDEMGLGKTVQAIAAMAALKGEGKSHFMVVCPASVLINWCREVGQHSLLQVTKIHGGDTEALARWLEQGDVAVTTYESISRFSLPEDFNFAMLVVDEAHYVKNPDTQRTKAMREMLQKTEKVLYMSGTPLENNVDEMCFLVSCLQPKLALELEGVKYISTAEQFREKLAPVYLRRTREDVLQELPDLTEKQQWCELGKAEKKAYKAAVDSENFMAMRQVSWNVEDLQDSSKAMRLIELCDKARDEGRKVIVFSFFRDTLTKVCGLLGDRCVGPVTGSVSPQRRQELVDAFGKAAPGAVLVSQVQAGGTGLNIQSASVVIFCEPQIKPSIENQAISRAYRMGQVRDVLVYRLLCEDTVDEKMLELLRKKQKQFDNFAEESVVGKENLKAETEEQTWIARMVAEEKARLSQEEQDHV